MDRWGKPHPTDGREHYSQHHREGWIECFQKWESSGYKVPDQVPVSDAPITGSGFLLAERARRDGFKACQKYLRGREQEVDTTETSEEASDESVIDPAAESAAREKATAAQ